jgi:hypothetical protein
MSAEATKVRVSARFLPSAEIVAIILAFAVDLAMTVSRLNYAGIWRIELSLGFALVGAVATLILPTQPHRRWYSMAALSTAFRAHGGRSRSRTGQSFSQPLSNLRNLVLSERFKRRCIAGELPETGRAMHAI